MESIQGTFTFLRASSVDHQFFFHPLIGCLMSSILILCPFLWSPAWLLLLFLRRFDLFVFMLLLDEYGTFVRSLSYYPCSWFPDGFIPSTVLPCHLASRFCWAKFLPLYIFVPSFRRPPCFLHICRILALHKHQSTRISSRVYDFVELMYSCRVKERKRWIC